MRKGQCFDKLSTDGFGEYISPSTLSLSKG